MCEFLKCCRPYSQQCAIRKVLARFRAFFVASLHLVDDFVQNVWDTYRSTGFRRVVKFFCLMFCFTLNQLINASMMCKFKRNHVNHLNVEHPHNHHVTRTQMMTSRDTLQGTAARFQRMEPLHRTHGQQRERQR